MTKQKKLLLVAVLILAIYTFYSYSTISSESLHDDNHIPRSYMENVEQKKPGYLNFKGEWINTDSPGVLDFIRRNLTVGPSDRPYNLTYGNASSALEFFKNAKNEPWVEIAIVMETLLPQGQPKVFLECGANEGEIGSNTLFLEIFKKWTGLLIEPDPIYFEEMKNKHRKAVHVNACVSPDGNASILPLHHPPRTQHIKNELGEELILTNPGRGHLVGYNDRNDDNDPRWFYVDVLCLPMYQIMQAANMTSFDFVVLDVEEAELSILETIPFDKVQMKFILVETIDEEYRKKVVKLLAKENFILHAIYEGNSHPRNCLFVRNDVYDAEKIKKDYSPAELYKLLIGDENYRELTPKDRLDFQAVLEVSSEFEMTRTKATL